MNRMKYLITLIGIFIISLSISAQTPATERPNRCATMEADRMLRQQFPQLGDKDDLEMWIQAKMSQRNGDVLENTVLTIPVIVHVIHDGEPIGNGTNISWAQISSQIDVLNEDYRRIMGTPGYNTHPDGADVEIEFCLATIGPDSNVLFEPGVNRVDRNSLSLANPPYTVSYTKSNIQPATYWDPDRYMNIWTVDLANDFLGYAQLPNSSTLPDLGTNYGPASTDGVVIRPTSFGRVGNLEAPYDKGRTTTHEVGHWLGLWHIWGDGPCGDDDYCADTPAQDSENYGCPSNNISCGTVDMVENYMDYTDDVCMNVFTVCQKNRMRTVMDNSPRRGILASSPACSGEIPPFALFESNSIEACEGSTINFYDLSNNTPNNWEWIFPGGTPNTSNAQNPAILYTVQGTYDVQLIVENAFGKDTILKENFITITSAGPNDFFSQGFENGLENWTTENPDNSVGWDIFQVGGTNQGTRAAGINLYDYAASGERDGLISPVIDLSNNTAVTLSFEHAYRRFSNSDQDSLIIYASTDGGNTYPYRLYAASEDGSGNFATNVNSVNSFNPSATTDWCYGSGWADCVTIDLSTFDGEQNFRLKFEAYNGYGNNLYIDNILIEGSCAPFVSNEPLVPLNEASLLVFPNPSDGLFSIHLENLEANQAEIMLFNYLGQRVFAQTFPVNQKELNTQLDLRNLSKGTYFLHIKGANNQFSHKILVR